MRYIVVGIWVEWIIKNNETLKWIDCHCWFYRHLSHVKKKQFITLLNTFINEKKFEGVGIEITYEMKVAVGGWAVLLVLNNPLGITWYKQIELISIYQGESVGTKQRLGQMLGGFHYCQIELAWNEVRDSSTKVSINRNTIVHEFAHALDYIDRCIDGHPTVLLTVSEHQQWKNVFSRQYIHSQPWYKRKKLWHFFGLASWNDYDPKDDSCVDVGELFAVSTELFFECPAKLLRHSPEIYQCLKLLYRIDPIIDLKKRGKSNTLRLRIMSFLKLTKI